MYEMVPFQIDCEYFARVECRRYGMLLMKNERCWITLSTLQENSICFSVTNKNLNLSDFCENENFPFTFKKKKKERKCILN